MATTQLIEVTSMAAEKLEQLVKEQGDDGSMLRVMVVPGAEGGFQYMLGLEKEAKEGDFIIDTETIQVLIDAESAPLIEGAQIDYVDTSRAVVEAVRVEAVVAADVVEAAAVADVGAVVTNHP